MRRCAASTRILTSYHQLMIPTVVWSCAIGSTMTVERNFLHVIFFSEDIGMIDQLRCGSLGSMRVANSWQPDVLLTGVNHHTSSTR
jgi:hypothetical protein